MDRFKNFVTYIRNGLCFSFSWIMLMLMFGAFFSGRKGIETDFLFKAFFMCLYGAVCFAVCFTDFLIRTKGFIFRLTVLFVTFIPVEVFMFYKMNLFAGKGTPGEDKNNMWQEWMDANKLSSANWSASKINEGTAAFAQASKVDSLVFSPSGEMVKGFLAKNPDSYTTCAVAKK